MRSDTHGNINVPFSLLWLHWTSKEHTVCSRFHHCSVHKFQYETKEIDHNIYNPAPRKWVTESKVSWCTGQLKWSQKTISTNCIGVYVQRSIIEAQWFAWSVNITMCAILYCVPWCILLIWYEEEYETRLHRDDGNEILSNNKRNRLMSNKWLTKFSPSNQLKICLQVFYILLQGRSYLCF